MELRGWPAAPIRLPSHIDCAVTVTLWLTLWLIPIVQWRDLWPVTDSDDILIFCCWPHYSTDYSILVVFSDTFYYSGSDYVTFWNDDTLLCPDDSRALYCWWPVDDIYSVIRRDDIWYSIWHLLMESTVFITFIDFKFPSLTSVDTMLLFSSMMVFLLLMMVFDTVMWWKPACSFAVGWFVVLTMVLHSRYCSFLMIFHWWNCCYLFYWWYSTFCYFKHWYTFYDVLIRYLLFILRCLIWYSFLFDIVMMMFWLCCIHSEYGGLHYISAIKCTFH